MSEGKYIFPFCVASKIPKDNPFPANDFCTDIPLLKIEGEQEQVIGVVKFYTQLHSGKETELGISGYTFFKELEEWFREFERSHLEWEIDYNGDVLSLWLVSGDRAEKLERSD